MASTYLTRTLGTPTNNKIWTFSAWVKRSKIQDGNYPNIFCANTLRDCIRFTNGDNLQVFFNEAGTPGANLQTNAKYRDVNGWYHIVVAVDTTQATSSNRIKIYVNGEQITSFSTENYCSQNHTNFINSAIQHRIGKDFSYTEYFDGYMSHIHFIDGTQYQASDFGETDSTTGEWKIKTSPSVSYGTNGFFILKDGNSVTDQSGNSNNFTVSGGTLTNTEDCPSNVFATWNTLGKGSNITLTNGNTSYRTSDTWECAPTTLAMTSGKYYAEFKLTSNVNSIGWSILGIEQPSNTNSWLNSYPGSSSTGYGYESTGASYNNSSSTATYGSSYTNGDIVGVAVDMDNKKIYFSKNGTWQNSGDPTSGATGTGSAYTISGSEYYFVGSGYHNTGNVTFDANFGNGYFGTTAVSSAGTNASGNGIFEYDVPSGYTALSTKGLNE